MKTTAFALTATGLAFGGAPAALAEPSAACAVHRASVTLAVDPKGRDRLQVLAPNVSAEPLWAERIYAKKQLRAATASAGDQIFLMFEGCDLARPVMIGFARPL